MGQIDEKAIFSGSAAFFLFINRDLIPFSQTGGFSGVSVAFTGLFLTVGQDDFFVFVLDVPTKSCATTENTEFYLNLPRHFGYGGRRHFFENFFILPPAPCVGFPMQAMEMLAVGVGGMGCGSCCPCFCRIRELLI